MTLDLTTSIETKSLSAVSDTGNITVEEQKLIEVLLSSKQMEDVRITIPDDVSDQDLIRSIHAALKVSSAWGKGQRYLQPLIGRLMVIMENRPSVIAAFGAKGMDDFCSRICEKEFGLNRSDVFYAKKVVRFFPDITPDEFVAVGMSKLKAIGKAFDWEPDNKSYEYKQLAKGLNRDQLIEKMADDGRDIKDMDMDAINTKVTKGTRKRWNTFLFGDVVAAYTGTTSPDMIVNRILDEIEADWTAVVEYRAAEERKILGE